MQSDRLINIKRFDGFPEVLLMGLEYDLILAVYPDGLGLFVKSVRKSERRTQVEIKGRGRRTIGRG